MKRLLFALLGLFLASAARAAITRDNPVLLFAGAEGTGSHTAAYTVGASVDFLVVGVSNWTGEASITNMSATFNGMSMTSAGTQMSAAGDDHVQLFYLKAPATGTHDVVVSRSSNNLGDVTIGAVGYVGVDQTTPVGTPVTAGGNDASPTVTVSSATGDLVVAALAYERAFSARGAGQTELWRDESDEPGLADEKAGAASVTESWTLASTGGWAVIGVPIKAAAVVPTPTPTSTPTRTSTPTPTVTPTPTRTNTPGGPAPTATRVPTRTPTPTKTPVNTLTPTPTKTVTKTPTATPTRATVLQNQSWIDRVRMLENAVYTKTPTRTPTP
jgi:hypothetical protein